MPDPSHTINAMPTKEFFVDMLIRDIPLERAILDLIDNCIDGAKRIRCEKNSDFSELSIIISVTDEEFSISDNCGGFSIETARDYAFRFGTPASAKSTDYSIGQFGVGMKRALFKFGRFFEVRSKTLNQIWAMRVDVDDWERDENNWVFDFSKTEESIGNAPEECGTKIIVKRLRPEVATSFGNEQFQRRLGEVIRSHQRQFLSSGLEISLNGLHLTNTDLQLLAGDQFRPAIEEFVLDEDSNAPINIRVIAGIGDSSPRDAGWYIICNGRVILSADRADSTGWGSIAEQKDGIPKYHNQYARFRGAVFFDCRSSKKLPWNTTKTGLDTSSPTWRVTFQKMLDHARNVMIYLNELDRSIDEYGTESSPLLISLKEETSQKHIENFSGSQGFEWNRKVKAQGPPLQRIQYTRERPKIQSLMNALDLKSAKAVGETTFDAIYHEQVDAGE